MNEAPSDNSIFKHGWKIAVFILILAATFRLWGVFELNEYLEDEAIQVPNAMSLGTYGTTNNWHWHHPHAGFLIMYGSIKILGNNPIGWRSGNIIFGTLSVAVLFLIGRLLYPGSAVPAIGAALLAFDPYHIYLSRNTYTEILVTFFFLLYLYLLLEYTENKRPTLPLAGLAMGITIGIKAYFVFAFPLVTAYALYRSYQRNELTRRVCFDFIASFLLLPTAVYFTTYFQWFSRGYSFSEFIQMKMNAVWELKQLKVYSFANSKLLEAGGKPWEWFIKPLVWGHQRLQNNTDGRFLLHFNNLPFRIFVFPSLIIATRYAWKNRLPQELLLPFIFGCCYLLVLVAQRPMFSCSSIVLLPFAYLGVARAVSLCAIQLHKEKLVYICVLSTALIWSTYIFPLISARLIPLAPFRPILSTVRYLGNF